MTKGPAPEDDCSMVRSGLPALWSIGMQQRLCLRLKYSILISVGLLWSCTKVLLPPPPTASVQDCPSPAINLPLETVRQQTIAGRDRYFNRFDYAPKDIVLDADTVRFQAREYDFVYCRANGQWTVQPGTLGKAWLAELEARHRGEAEFSTLTWKDQSYQYRVIREPIAAESPEAYQSVVLEIIPPDQETAEQHTLYTVDQISGAEVMGGLGMPRITTALEYGDLLWWTVAFDQGEGYNGIATIVSYDPATADVTLIQPDEIRFQQILDLVLMGDPAQPTLLMGIKASAEGMSNVPASGLVIYQPESEDLTTGVVQSYTPYNSPLVGHIPTQLVIADEQLWIGTRNGACRLDWQAPEQPESWSCWRFIAQATLPKNAAIPVYDSLLDPAPATTLAETTSGTMVEVLWWMLTEAGDPSVGRYEVRVEEGWEVTLEQGASPELAPRSLEDIAGRVPMFWPGYGWHWQGDRFVRSFDGYLNNLISGDRGIGPLRSASLTDWNAIRGDLDLLELSAETTRLRYYSGWVDDAVLTPFPAVVERPYPEAMPPDPLIEIDRQLRSRTVPD
ncbi:MAG: hypothetical protein AAF722_14475 [Cyanobacteria bacterium P01_C01_bin.70]